MNGFIVLALVGFAAAVPQQLPFKVQVYEIPEQTTRTPIGIESIKNSPVIALVKYEDGYTAYMLEHGLITLASEPSHNFHNLRTMLKTNNLNRALVFQPITLIGEQNPALQQIRQEPITKFEIPQNYQVQNIAKFATAYVVPFIIFYDQEQFDSRNYQNMLNHGEVDMFNFPQQNL